MMLKLLISLIAYSVLGVIVIGACNGDASSPAETPSPGSTASASPESTPPDSLQLSPVPFLEATAITPVAPGCAIEGLTSDINFDDPESKFATGEPVQMTLTLTNCAHQPVRLFYRDSQRYEFVAEDEDGNEVWRWSRDQAFAQEKGEETIASAEKVDYTESWDQRNNDGEQVAPGRYKIFGFSVGCGEESATDSGCRFGPGRLIEITR